MNNTDNSLRIFTTWLLISTCCVSTLRAMDDAEIPADAPQDSVMATPEEIREIQDWANLAFFGARPARPQSAIHVEVRRQDHSVLRFGQSCIETPMKLGDRDFTHGLGTHANSEIILHLPPNSKEFRAWIGVDTNPNTGGSRGSVEFSVDAGGVELYHSPVLRGTNAPVQVKVPIPQNTTELTLKVGATADGPAFDQADWAEACVLTDEGRVWWADEDRMPFVERGLPFSFRYGGAPFTSVGMERSPLKNTELPGRTTSEATWTDKKTGLRVGAAVTSFKRYPAVEWVLTFENTGTVDTEVIDEVQTLDVRLRTGYFRNPVQLHQLAGDVCAERSFLPAALELEQAKPIILAPAGGRPSSGAFPFFNLQYVNEGLITAVGWSGQWKAFVERSATGPTVLRAGQEKFSLRLHPREKIRSPRILVMPWKGDRIVAQNRFRRLLLFEYAPRENGRPLRLPIALQAFDRYVNSQPNWGTEAVQIRAANAAADMGCDTHWLDAAWFEGGFPNGVGNWYCPQPRFPNGLKPVSDACHQRGLKFIVWFEPERVAVGSLIAREHPEFVFGGAKGGLFKLGDPEARRWIADLLSSRITEFGIDMYRNDFNIDPLETWRGADAPDRQGATEAAYVEGHYALWDELLARHPGLAIDNCAGGGRRIDIETLKRSVPLWHSDTGCAPGHAEWNQSHIPGLGLYVPLFGACAWTPSAYEVRSAATAGLICQFAFLDKDFSFDAARAAVAEVKQNQKYWYGDFYPLSPPMLGPAGFTAYQLHRSDLDSGIVLAFRRGECPYPAMQTGLHALHPEHSYSVELIDESFAKEGRTLTGKDLSSDFELRLPKRGTSLLVRYKPAK